MKSIRLLGMLAVAGVTCATNVLAEEFMASQNAIYFHARNNNKTAISNLVKRGYSIDAVDAQGNTALCMSLKEKNRQAYNMLREMGANPKHECVQKLTKEYKEPVKSAADPETWKLRDMSWTTISTAVAGAVVVGVAAGSGGGGGSGGSGGSGGGGEGGGGGGGDLPPVTDPSIRFFQTPEYYKGGFLDKINAAEAYAKVYDIADDGSLVSNLFDVKVGVIDNGVNAANPEFSGKSITGYNYDYGPCRNENTENCWTYKDSYSSEGSTYNNVAYIVLDGKTYLVSMTQAEYNAWEGKYPEDYQSGAAGFAPNPNDENPSHGTHIAGIIAANRDEKGMQGVAFSNASIVAVRWDFMSPLDAPIVNLVNDGVKVINMSFGSPSTAFLNASTATINNFNTMKEGLKYAAEKNVVMVMSAGNDGKNGIHPEPGVLNGAPLLPEFSGIYKPDEDSEPVVNPYSLKDLFITVVAVDGSGNLADYSNKCGVTHNYCISAPGTIFSTSAGGDGLATDPDYTIMEGTSMAAPVVTGSVAFLMGAYPYMTPQQVVQLVFETATDLGVAGVDEIYGHGLINLGKAVSAQGALGIATSNSVRGDRVLLSSTSMSVPAVFQNSLMKALPKSITAFDKYNRPYDYATANFVRATHNGYKNFKNDLYAFSSTRKVKRIDNGSNISFGYAPAVVNNKGVNIGMVDIKHQNDNNSVRFFYSENTKYGSDRYSDNTLFNPYLAMNQAYGVQNSYNFGQKFNIKMGFTMGENGLYDGTSEYNDTNFDNQSYAFSSEASFALNDDVKLTAMSGVLAEDNAMLGLNGDGAFDINDSNTYYMGMAVSWKPYSRFTLTGAYYQGWTDPQNLSSNLMRTSSLMSDSFALDGRYDLNKSDTIGMQISSPLRIYNGEAKFNIPVGRDDNSDTVYRQEFSSSLKPNAREYKFALYHMREVDEDLSFRSEIGMRLNPEHQNDADTDYRAMFSLNWNF